MFQQGSVDGASLDDDDASGALRRLAAASRRIDRWCARHFFTAAGSRYFNGNGYGDIEITDLVGAPDAAAGGIALDEDGDRTFEVELAAGTDYYLESASGDPDDIEAYPRTVLRLDDVNGQRSTFTRRRRLVQFDATTRWGYTEATERVVDASGTPITGTLSDADDLTLAVSDDGSPALCPGQTLRLSATPGDPTGEQVYIKAGATSPFTVVRGVNGTTAVGHSSVEIDRFTYIPEVVEATFLLAVRIWQRREDPDSQELVTTAREQAGRRHGGELDPDIAELLHDYRRLTRRIA